MSNSPAKNEEQRTLMNSDLMMYGDGGEGCHMIYFEEEKQR